jgi:predicted glycosyltransferase
MKILLDIGHPKDINLFINVVDLLVQKGHTVEIFARVKENSRQMLDDYGLEYKEGVHFHSMMGKMFGLFLNEFKLFVQARKFKPDVFVSPGSPYSAHVSRLVKKPHLAFSDTEIASFVTKLVISFTDEIYTSTSFYLDFGDKHKRFRGYYELAYLSPKYFQPNISVLNKYGLHEGYIIIRLSSLLSHHDIHAKGLDFKSENDIVEFIAELEKYNRVILISDISSNAINKYQLEFQPNDLHSLLYYASLCIGDGASMISEAAVLGVPAIYVSNTRRGYLDELENKYGLSFTYNDRNLALVKAKTLLENEKTKVEWHQKRDSMLYDSVDVVEFIVESIESFSKGG